MYGYADVSGAFRIKRLYTAFAEDIGSDYQFAGERHNFWELLTVTGGEVGVTAGEETGILRKGEAILHSPMEFHRVWYAGNTPGQILIFSFAAENMPSVTAKQFSVPDLGVPLALLEKLCLSYEMSDYNVVGIRQPELRGQILLKQLELFLLEMLGGSGQTWGAANSRSAENYARLVRCLESNIRNNLSVDEIAGLCNMSTVNAKQTFARYAGMGIRNYFNRLKIERAIAMLRSGSSVQETAAALSFSSPNYFSTTFKRITGKSPTAYK